MRRKINELRCKLNKTRGDKYTALQTQQNAQGITNRAVSLTKHGGKLIETVTNGKTIFPQVLEIMFRMQYNERASE